MFELMLPMSVRFRSPNFKEAGIANSKEFALEYKECEVTPAKMEIFKSSVLFTGLARLSTAKYLADAGHIPYLLEARG